jgi:tRNA pseudouridine55 synthase
MIPDDAGKNGLLLLNKQAGLSSFASLALIKKALGTGKVGHTGTLDRFASGLLLVLAGRAVKLAPWFLERDKWYEGTVRFGLETDTLDPEGAVVAEGPPPSPGRLREVLDQFRGDILQAPPEYSRISVGGQRAARLARLGRPVEMQKRPVTIYELELVSYEPPLARIRVHCSKGTYIRSLARDMALAAGSRGHLASLCRTRIAGFSLPYALDLSGLADEVLFAAVHRALTPINEEVFHTLGLPAYRADEETIRRIIRGRPLAAGEGPLSGMKEKAAGIFDSRGGLAAVIEQKQAGVFSYGYVYARD